MGLLRNVKIFLGWGGDDQPLTASSEDEEGDEAHACIPLRRKGLVYRFHTRREREKVHVIVPKEMRDAQTASDYVKAGVAVLMNLQKLDRRVGQRIVDFLSGTCYALGGQSMRIDERLFFFTPANFPVSGDAREISHLFLSGFDAEVANNLLNRSRIPRVED